MLVSWGLRAANAENYHLTRAARSVVTSVPQNFGLFPSKTKTCGSTVFKSEANTMGPQF
jgi:hypothetical protein